MQAGNAMNYTSNLLNQSCMLQKQELSLAKLVRDMGIHPTTQAQVFFLHKFGCLYLNICNAPSSSYVGLVYCKDLLI